MKRNKKRIKNIQACRYNKRSKKISAEFKFFKLFSWCPGCLLNAGMCVNHTYPYPDLIIEGNSEEAVKY